MHIALWYTVYFVTNSYTTQDGNMNFVISQISIVGTPTHNNILPLILILD